MTRIIDILSSIQAIQAMAWILVTIGWSDSFRPFEYQTSLLFCTHYFMHFKINVTVGTGQDLYRALYSAHRLVLDKVLRLRSGILGFTSVLYYSNENIRQELKVVNYIH